MYPKVLIIVFCLLGIAGPSSAQSLEDLNIQLHGYATQGFLYTSNNNIFTTTSSNGSPQWTEAVINVSSVPTSGLRIAVQGRYELLGNYANQITLDYAAADYKPAEQFGIRFGKVKVPSGLFNEVQDIDPSYEFALLPQSVYPIASRNGQLAIFGAVAYGALSIPAKLGKVEYRGWSGETDIAGNDGYLLGLVEEGFSFPNGLKYMENGLAVHWKTPLPGLMIGASDSRKNAASSPTVTPYGPGFLTSSTNNAPNFFARYERQKLMIALEQSRLPGFYGIQITGAPVAPPSPSDIRGIYAMATYKVTDKLTAGIYDSQANNHTPNTPLGPGKYSKDWAFSARYDLSQYLYAKAEEHLIDGTYDDFDQALNPAGLKPNTKLTVLKVAVSF